MIQGLYLGLVPPLTGGDLSELLREPRVPFMVGLLPLAASLLMLAFVVSARKGMRRGRSGRG